METLIEPLSFAFFQKGLLVATLSGALLGQPAPAHPTDARMMRSR